MAARAQRYTAVAIVLHWAIAVAILFMIPMGLWMHESAEHGDVSANIFRAYQLHKSIGLTVLALSLVRLGWRLANPPPPMPEHMPGWERFIATATHWAFYALMIGLPLSGWLYVSTGWSIHDEAPLPVATHWFGLFQVPALFGLNQADLGVREDTAEAALTAHAYLAYAALGLAALHVLAALKHHLFDKDEVLAHMVPGLRAPFETEPAPKNPVRLAVLGIGLSVVVIALAAALFALLGGGSATTSPQTQSSFEVVEAPATTTEAPATTTTVAPPVATGQASAWRVDAARSSIGFAFSMDDGSGNSSRIDGRFARWRADIRFDPNDLENSAVTVAIQTASASDGVASHDAYMREPGWFDVDAHPTATFRATDFRRRGEGYEARGELTIKDRERNVRLPFTLTINGDTAVMNGTVAIDREEFDLGKDVEGSDMISRNVDVTIRVHATRSQ
ncbi:MAG: YceI family protein [Alphaproteobacteria bacterium]|nr:YceI family protein [Alphaproteobacteria bacterium]